jgi:hypothetical protein
MVQILQSDAPSASKENSFTSEAVFFLKPNMAICFNIEQINPETRIFFLLSYRFV